VHTLDVTGAQWQLGMFPLYTRFTLRNVVKGKGRKDVPGRPTSSSSSSSIAAAAATATSRRQ